MSRPSVVSFALLVFGLGTGCTSDKSSSSDDGVDYYPILEISTNRLEFSTVNWGETRDKEFTVTNGGDIAMGIEGILLRTEEMESNFTVTYYASQISCPESSETTARHASPMMGRTPDTGGGDTGAGDTGGGDTAGTTDTASGETAGGPLVLDAGCSIPVTVTLAPMTVGTILSSVEILTYTDTASTGSPAFYKDPDNARGIVVLEGAGDKTRGNLVTSPTTIDFGQVYEGQNPTDYVTIRNVGTGDLTLGSPALESDCAEGYSIVDAFDNGRVLTPGTSALIQVEYAPTSEDRARCTLTFTSDDADDGTVSVALQANLGSDSSNSPPTVVMRQPSSGYFITSLEPFDVEINAFDLDQPASTLSCNLRSIVTGDTLADCAPADDSGHVFISVDPTKLDAGTDTLVVTVKDGEGTTASAGVSIINRADYPGSDDDGDGYGDDADLEQIDCDDDDINSYPYATEINDGSDNDCDGTVDEGTDGGDDDEDGFSEDEGDCDDTNANTYPEAGESGDNLDNDCDGTVDEGTSLSDDDGDGFSETEDDCDDTDPAISPAAEELCDGEDNDCNGLKDTQDGCITSDSDPIIIGGIQMGVTTLGIGETTTMTVLAYDADGQDLIYAWQQDTELTNLGYNTIDNPIASTITFTAPPALPDGSKGEVYHVYVSVVDEDGNVAFDTENITVLPQPVVLERTTTTTSSGCGGSSALFFPLSGIAAAAALARRRRQVIAG